MNIISRYTATEIDRGGIEGVLPLIYGERLELALDRLEADRLSGVHAFQRLLVFHNKFPVN